MYCKKNHINAFSVMIWILVVLMACTYFMFLYACYGSNISHIFLNTDQGHFKSIVFFLEKHWTLFPASLENISNTCVPYHHLDSQLKWLLTLFVPTNTAFFAVNFVIYAFLGYLIFNLNLKGEFSILILLFAVSMLKLPSSGEVLDMVHMPFGFTIKSDIFHNTNTVLALVLLTFVWNRPFYIRIMVYFLSFYVKSPAVPAFFILEIYMLFFHETCTENCSLNIKILKFILVILVFLLSYYCFFYNGSGTVTGYVNSGHCISFRIRKNIVFFANGAFLYDFILLILAILFFEGSEKMKVLQYFYCILGVSLIVYDSVGLVKINIGNFYQVEFFLKYVFLIIILYLSQDIKTESMTVKLLDKLIMLIILFNCYFFAQFAGALGFHDYHRFSEYLDNSELIKITSSITNQNDVVALNNISSPIRNSRQLQLCGIIKNPLWVSNLSYVAPVDKLKVVNDWKILQQALQGKHKFPRRIKWLILDKTDKNYNLDIICKNFSIIKKTQIYILLKRHMS